MSAQYWIFELFNQQIPRESNNCRGILGYLGTNVYIGPYLSSFFCSGGLLHSFIGQRIMLHEYHWITSVASGETIYNAGKKSNRKPFVRDSSCTEINMLILFMHVLMVHGM